MDDIKWKTNKVELLSAFRFVKWVYYLSFAPFFILVIYDAAVVV